MQPRRQQVLDFAEAAALLAVNEEDVAWLVNTGQLPARNIDTKMSIAVHDVQRLVDAYVTVARRRIDRED
jgi:hypothetical protein